MTAFACETSNDFVDSAEFHANAIEFAINQDLSIAPNPFDAVEFAPHVPHVDLEETKSFDQIQAYVDGLIYGEMED